ncbi:MAG TPA: UbiA prenyltransferase family protein, partial [Phycisphaerae bacterium]|nr:UbiA prenyltransferase family protein [Phycisphaerae bacterium]
MPYLELMRPGQWTKNLFVFAGLVFGLKLDDRASLVLALLGFACFCLVSSAVYVFNDIHDRHEDRIHPTKRLRPIASGRVGVSAAAIWGALLLVGGLLGGWALNRAFFVVVALYVVLQTAYTFWFKHATLLDVITIGLGFVLRAVAGALVVGVTISHWLVLCTFTLCLVLGFGKRRCELNALGN